MSHVIGLVASDRDPLPPIAQAFLNLVGRLDLDTMISRQADGPWPVAVA